MEFTSQLTTETDLFKIADELTKDKKDQYNIGFLFISTFNKKSTADLVKFVRNRVRVDYLVGCTCAGIIGTTAEIEQKPATALILGKLPEGKIVPFSLNQNQLEAMTKAEDWYNFFNIYPNENPKFLILPDPFLFDMNQFLAGLNQTYPGCPVIGGLASGASQPHENLLFINDQTFKEGIVGITLRGDFDVKAIVSQGCRPIGESYIVTRAEGNIIHTLAGRTFVQILEEVLQKVPARDKLLAQEAILIGIAMSEYTHEFKRGDFLIRTVLGIDEETGAGAIADYVKIGKTVQFHVRDAQAATEDLYELLQSQQRQEIDQKPKGALVFSCNGRGEGLFREKNHDIALIQKVIGPVPAAGFFCAGEVGPVGGNNFLHGFTSSIALFYPRQQ